MVESRYQDFTLEAMVADVRGGARAHAVSGRLGGREAPARNHHPITVLQLELDPGSSYPVTLPADDRAFLYVRSGRLGVDGREELRAGSVGWSDPVGAPGTASTLELRAEEGDEPVRLLLASGAPIGEPVVARGPFVMNSQTEIAQAFDDYRRGRFGPIPRLARVGA
jgi:hypothetical protein